LEPSQWTNTYREILGSRDQGGETSAIFKTCLRNPELCRNWMPLTSYLLSAASTVPARDKELLILRTAWLCRADYPWAGHFSVGKRVGFTDEDILRDGAASTRC
jgi:alkylhydroperoxidase family enzyme